VLIGSGTELGAQSLRGELRCVEVGPFRPGAWAAALGPLVAAEAIVVLPASADGRDLAPRLAGVLERPLFAGAIKVTDTQVTMARDGGLTMHTIAMPSSCVATLLVGVRGVEPVTDDAPAEAAPQIVHVELPATSPEPALVEVLEADASSIDLAEATRIVSGGAGLDTVDRFGQLADLGQLLGASVGATRVITDRGWIEHSRQIGTTGVEVDPHLYLAFGISGAVQHTSGLGDPDKIISVNLDAHCPMMQLADLAVVADANAVLGELIDVLVQRNGARAAHG
jgi:electron transfer flavoprotein alpha subunit